jgi:hypothetical protein
MENRPAPNGKSINEGLNWLLREARAISELGQKALPLIEKCLYLVDQGQHKSREFVNLAAQVQTLDQSLGERGRFQEITVDFQPELLAFQHLQQYKIQRAKNTQSSLRSSLESIQRSFVDLKKLADQIIAVLLDTTMPPVGLSVAEFPQGASTLGEIDPSPGRGLSLS